MISNTCKYAIRAVAYIAKQSDKPGNIPLKEVSEALDIPMPFMAKILQVLARTRILYSKKGPNGGFILQKPADEISLYDVIKAIDGDDLFTYCVVHNNVCSCSDTEKSPCMLHGEYTKIRMSVTKLFKEKSIGGIVKTLKDANDIEI